MTALPVGASAALAYFETLTDDAVRATLTNEDPEARFTTHMSRKGEPTQTVGSAAQIRAIFTSDWFWALAALCPNNRLWWGGKTTDLDKRREGAPIHFPDYLMLLVLCAAGIAGIGSVGAALATLRDERAWKDFVEHIDEYVPDGWTRLSDLPKRNPNKKTRRGTIATPGTKRNDRTKARQRNRSNVIGLRRPLPAPPTPDEVAYWMRRWRGVDKQRQPLPPTHDYYGLRAKVLAAFETMAIDQAQAMGVLDKTQDFAYGNPDRNQFLGFDGVVFAAPRKGPAPSVGQYTTGEGITVRGTKWGISSTRVDGQSRSRIITSLHHIHENLDGSYASEQAVVREVIPRLHATADGGMKGLLVDSVIRGNDVIALQRQGITVVNNPHAASNPKGGPGKRHNESRVEKSHLRRVVTHQNDFGNTCEHYIFAVGGEFLQALMNNMGEYQLERVEHLDYQQRWNRDGTRREYHRIRIACANGPAITERVSLFHTSPMSTDPDYNWGEVVRVYPPGSAAFKFLYGARNDTEVRHADLKARVKHLPRDVAGQELRLLGAAIASNALSWQIHLQAHGEPNVIDDTA